MSLESFARWLEKTQWAWNFSGSPYAYPIVLATHLSCIAVFGGMIFITDLRLLGWKLGGLSVTDVVQKLRVWKWIGFFIMITCGGLLAGSEAGKYYVNTYFWIKMTFLALLGVHALVFRRSVYQNTVELDRAKVMPGRAKLAGALSLILWISVVCAGRMIGYYTGPKGLPPVAQQVGAARQ